MLRLLSLLLSKEHGPELKASSLVAAIGVFFVFLLASAFADGEVRRTELPLRALLGNEAYEALAAGEPTPQHYMQRPPTPVWSRWRSDAPRVDRSKDRLAPDFSLQAQDGSTFRLSEHRGKVLILNFWTVTCQPCIEEMPSLLELGRMLKGRKDVELVLVSTDRDWDTVRTVLRDDAPFISLLDPDRAVVRGKFGTQLYPETWLIDREGIIRLRVDGRRDWSNPIVLDVIDSYL